MNPAVKSIQNKLLAYSRRRQQNHQLTLIRFFQERFLYRLSMSAYGEAFLLKGGVLIYVFQGVDSRPTRDIDFLAADSVRDQEAIVSACQAICQIPCLEDYVLFDPNSITDQPLNALEKYPGTRIKLTATLGNITQRLQLDFGNGDQVYPLPNRITYPTLLDLPAPKLAVYPLETVLAEKLEAVVSLGEFNTRMKDFYDLYSLLEKHEVDQRLLSEAIRRTFANRQAKQHPLRAIFSEAFRNNVQRNQNWVRFLDQAGIGASLPFGYVLDQIAMYLEPSYND